MARKKRNKQKKDELKAPVKNTTTPSKKSDKMDADEENPQARNSKERPMVKVKRYLTYLWPPYFLDLVFCSLLRVELFIYRKVAGQMPMFLEGHIDSAKSKEQTAIEDLTRENEKIISEMKASLTKSTEENEGKGRKIDELENDNKRLRIENQDLVRKNDQQKEENKRNGKKINDIENENMRFQSDIQDLVRKNDKQLEENRRKNEKINQLENENKLFQTEKQDLVRKYEKQLEENERKDSMIDQLQTDNRCLQTEITERKSEIENKIKIISSLKEEFNRMRNEKATEIRQLMDKNYEVERKCNSMENEKQDALRRLSELVSVRLRDNNPNIADLNDQCRPTKLAEMFSELYDNEWTSAYEMLENNSFTEKQAIIVLLDTVMIAYGFCEELVEKSWQYLNDWFLNEDIPGSQQTTKWLKDSRKSKVKNKVNNVLEDFCTIMTNMCIETKLKALLSDEFMTTYFANCIQLCLLMVATDPPVVLGFPGWKPIQLTKIKVNNPLKQETTEKSPEVNCRQLEVMPTEECPGGLPGQHGEEHRQLQIKTNTESADGSTSDEKHQQAEMMKQEKINTVTALNGECQKPKEIKNLESGRCQRLEDTAFNPGNVDDVTAHEECKEQIEIPNPQNADDVTEPHAIHSKLEEVNVSKIADDGKRPDEKCDQQEKMPKPENADDVTVPDEIRFILEEVNYPEIADDGKGSDEKCDQQEKMPKPENADDVTVPDEIRFIQEDVNYPEIADDGKGSDEKFNQQEEMQKPENADDVTVPDEFRPKLKVTNNSESADDGMASNGECQQQGEIPNPDRAVNVIAPNEECQKADEMTNAESTADNTASPEKAIEKEVFDKDTFKEYTKRGKFLDFVVWPAMYLHKGGPLLSKGIAQGTKEQHTLPNMEVWTWRQS